MNLKESDKEMALPDGMKITDAGRALLAKAMQGKELQFMRGVTGDGYLPEETDITKLTELVNFKRNLPIQSIELPEGVGIVEVFLDMDNRDLAQGFWLREFGLIAKDPDTEEEILYAYRNVGDEASYLPAAYGTDVVEYSLDLVTIIDQAPNVTAYISSHNNYVTYSHLEIRIKSLFADSDDVNYIWTCKEGDVQKLRPVTLQRLKDLIIGRHDYQNLNKRVENLENAQCQTILEFEKSDQYPDYHNFIVEDFLNTNMLDMYKSRVVGAVTGDDSLDVENIIGLLPWSWYTLSDGIHSELVQVKSINRENGINRVILASPITYTYELAMSTLYRTSAVIRTGYAEGNSTAKLTAWYANIDWRGKSSEDPYTVAPDISQASASQYIMDGNAILSADGYFTLSA